MMLMLFAYAIAIAYATIFHYAALFLRDDIRHYVF